MPSISTASARPSPITPSATRWLSALVALLAASLAACASAPPPTAAMQHWQTERSGPDAAAVAAGQPTLTDRADDAFARAEQAHAEGDTVARNHHLRVADIRWRTAVTRHQQADEAAALAEAQARVDARRATLADIEAEADALRSSIAANRGAAVTAGARPMPTTPREKAEYMLDTAVVDLARADEVEAENRAPLLFTKASLAYDEAASHYTNGRFEQSTRRASDATKLAREAYEEALPSHRKDRLEERLQARRDELLTRLLRVATPVVSEDDISVSLVGYFPPEGEDLRASKDAEINALADIVAAFPEYGIKLVGHTDSAGHPTDNLMLSQARALAVRQALEDHGVDRDRLTSIGEGESKAVEIAQGDVINTRVDVIFEPRPVKIVEDGFERARASR